jgi:hypothetical protein
MHRSKIVAYLRVHRPERPTYGKRMRPVFTPRITARRLMARFVWRVGSHLQYRAMIYKRLWK